MNNLPPLNFLSFFFSQLSCHHICYGILRNAEEVAAGDAHDTDMTVEASALVQTETILLSVARQLGWQLHLKTGSCYDRYDIKCYHFFRICEDNAEISMVHIDIFPVFSWGGYILIGNNELLKSTGQNTLFRTVAPAAEAVSKLFIRLLYNTRIKEKYYDSIRMLMATYAQEAMRLMDNFLPHQVSLDILRSVQEQRWEDINRRRGELISHIRRRARSYKFRHMLYLMRKACGRAGLMVVLEGTDGSIKSAIIERLPDILGATYPKESICCYHRRPMILRPERPISKDKIDDIYPSSHHVESHGFIKSLIKLCFYSVDYVLGYWLRVRWQLAKGRLVIFDRYYGDFYIERLRYRIKLPLWIIDAIGLLIPKPDITFILTGAAESIQARKKEMCKEEVQGQIDAHECCNHQFNNTETIDEAHNIPEVVAAVSRGVLRTGAKHFPHINKH